jgi:hypothetical protein
MKRLSVIMLMITLLILAPVIVMAVGVGTYTTSYNQTWDSTNKARLKVLTVSITDDTAGTTVALVEADVMSYFLCSMETNPGATAPTDDYDIVINTAGGVDILGGAGANRDTANTEIAYPTVDATTGQKACVPINGALSLVLSGNSVNNATTVIKLFLTRP